MIFWLQPLFHRLLSRRAAHLARRLGPHIPLGSTLLDIGSGTGHNARALERVTGGSCLEIDAVDFHVVGPGPILFTGSRLPLLDDAVDVCLLLFVLNYAADPVALLRDAARVASRRVLLLHSTGPGFASRAALGGRNWLQGQVGFEVCRRLGLIPPARLPRQLHRLFQREHLEEIIADAGLILTRVEPEPGFAAISRDLFIVDRPGGASPDPLGPIEPPA